jgi:hypothetical protein
VLKVKPFFANTYPSPFDSHCVLNIEAPYCTCTLQTIAKASVNIQLKTDSLISYNRTCSAFESGWGCFHWFNVAVLTDQPEWSLKKKKNYRIYINVCF